MRLTLTYSVLLLAILLIGFAHGAYADVLAVEGRPMAVGVKVVEVNKGRLYYQLPAGRVVSRPVADVKFLQITGWSAFNEAEQQQRDGELRQAVASYERALHELKTSQTSGRLDRHLLVKCRLLRVYDELGRFDRAVTLYMDLIERMPTALDALRPTRLPAAGSSFLPAASAAIDIAIQRYRGTAIGESLAKWRATWPGQSDDRKDSADEPNTSPGESEKVQQLRARLDAIETLVADNQWDEALAKIAPLQKGGTGLLRADLFYWQGRARLGKSQNEQGPAAQADARRAGLAFMRVVIHFPGHRLAPECLYRAGQICQQAGRKDLAQRLWSELRRSYPTYQLRIEN